MKHDWQITGRSDPTDATPVYECSRCGAVHAVPGEPPDEVCPEHEHRRLDDDGAPVRKRQPNKK